MPMTVNAGFRLSPRLEEDTLAVAELPLSSLRMMNDSRYPWLILVPRIADIEEIHHLDRAARDLLMEEISAVAKALSDVSAPDKINIGALGNIVRQLHIHVIARFEADEAWPGPVWGRGEAKSYDETAAAVYLSLLRPRVALHMGRQYEK